MDIVVTDLTFLKDGKVCIAGIEPTTGACIRPEPMQTRAWCADNGLEPGMVLRGTVRAFPKVEAPHTEDRFCKDLRLAGEAGPVDLCGLLAAGCAGSVCDGFGCELPEGRKYYPRDEPPAHSITTIQARTVQVVYTYSKVKAHVTDATGREYAFLPVADLLLREYVLGQAEDDRVGACARINNHLRTQGLKYCRIGLGRAHDMGDGRDGYWLQVNGVYSCPVSWREVA